MVEWIWCVSAWAQDRVVWDFDTRVPGWFEGYVAPSPFPGSGNALTIDMRSEDPGDVVGYTTCSPTRRTRGS